MKLAYWILISLLSFQGITGFDYGGYPEDMEEEEESVEEDNDNVAISDVDMVEKESEDSPEEKEKNISNKKSKKGKKHGKTANWDVILVANLGEKSKSENDTFISKLKHIVIQVRYDDENPSLSKVVLEKKDAPSRNLRSTAGRNGRGMELTEVVLFQDKPIACDQATGILYVLPSKKKARKNGTADLVPGPWVTLWDNTHNKAFACKWMTVKDDHLYVGAGKPSNGSSTGIVRRVSANGHVTKEVWKRELAKVAKYAGANGTNASNSVSHEAVGWSSFLSSWAFLPNVPKTAEASGNSSGAGGPKIIIVDEGFSRYTPVQLQGNISSSETSFTSFKWIPGTEDQLAVALKTDPAGGTYIIAFEMGGHVILGDTKIADEPYEGLAFLRERFSEEDKKAYRKWKEARLRAQFNNPFGAMEDY